VKKVFATLTIGLFVILGCQNPKRSNSANKELTVPPSIAAQSDTLMITDMKNISDPFSFGKKPLTHLLNEIDIEPSFKSLTEHSDSTMNENGDFANMIIGSSYTLKYGEDFFQIYRRTDSVEFLLGAEILTNQFSNKWNVQIGMNKEQVIKKLSQFNIDKIPTTLIIGDLEYTFIQFDFEKEKLRRIKYDFYVD
jgi:hypothetical protein